ncbi:hypothetical protein NDU88_005281 [Pleurodeles waltl]|uniref:Uncharacterized protein n=1 Tax=Pleurodeles waltl TaxID=8319 RepID=A0AAV7MXK5_PLEWA|nr:hypothetical protein NDU88_005281 [Pleurodeles waltl]
MHPQDGAAQQHEQPSWQCPCRLLLPLSSSLQAEVNLPPRVLSQLAAQRLRAALLPANTGAGPKPPSNHSSTAPGSPAPHPDASQDSPGPAAAGSRPAAVSPQAPTPGPPLHGSHALHWTGACCAPQTSRLRIYHAHSLFRSVAILGPR